MINNDRIEVPNNTQVVPAGWGITAPLQVIQGTVGSVYQTVLNTATVAPRSSTVDWLSTGAQVGAGVATMFVFPGSIFIPIIASKVAGPIATAVGNHASYYLSPPSREELVAIEQAEQAPASLPTGSLINATTAIATSSLAASVLPPGSHPIINAVGANVFSNLSGHASQELYNRATGDATETSPLSNVVTSAAVTAITAPLPPGPAKYAATQTASKVLKTVSDFIYPNKERNE